MSRHKQRIENLNASIGKPSAIVVWKVQPGGQLRLMNSGGLELPPMISRDKLNDIEATHILVDYEGGVDNG